MEYLSSGFDNAFAKSELTDTVFVEPPQLFGPESGKDLVLKLLNAHIESSRQHECSLNNSRLGF